jgi:hypothetical protein
MKPSRPLIIALFVVLVAISEWIYVRRSSTSSDLPKPRPSKAEMLQRAAQRRARKTAILADWVAQPAVSIASPDLASAIRTMPSQDAFVVPGGAEVVRTSDVSPKRLRDLDAAVAGLLKAYSQGAPQTVYQYMRSRGTKLHPDRRKLFETWLVPHGNEDLRSLPDEEIFSRTWREYRGGWSHWHSLVPHASWRRIWDARGVAVEDIRGLGRALNDRARYLDSERLKKGKGIPYLGIVVLETSVPSQGGKSHGRHCVSGAL